jgi:hypothetical protein
MRAHAAGSLVVLGIVLGAMAACDVPKAQEGGGSAPLSVDMVVEGEACEPRVLTAVMGERVRIGLRNAGVDPAEFEIVDLKAKDVRFSGLPSTAIPKREMGSMLDRGAQGTPRLWLPAHGRAAVEFTPTDPGTYRVVCGAG